MLPINFSCIRSSFLCWKRHSKDSQTTTTTAIENICGATCISDAKYFKTNIYLGSTQGRFHHNQLIIIGSVSSRYLFVVWNGHYFLDLQCGLPQIIRCSDLETNALQSPSSKHGRKTPKWFIKKTLIVEIANNICNMKYMQCSSMNPVIYACCSREFRRF